MSPFGWFSRLSVIFHSHLFQLFKSIKTLTILQTFSGSRTSEMPIKHEKVKDICYSQTFHNTMFCTGVLILLFTSSFHTPLSLLILSFSLSFTLDNLQLYAVFNVATCSRRNRLLSLLLLLYRRPCVHFCTDFETS